MMVKSNLIKICILLAAFLCSFLPDLLNLNQNLSLDGKIVVRMVIFMIFLWLTEVIPISITALLPILFSTFLLEIETSDVVRQYASPVVFLLLGGFIIALGFEKSNLHKRIALKTLLILGDTREKIILCVIFSTAFFSMWLSNTATCLLMLPIVKNIIDNNFKSHNDLKFSKILIISVAYSSSIGGMATPIGTIPNAVMIGFLKENHGIEIDFIEWFTFCFPLVFVLLVFLFFFLRTKFTKNKEEVNKKFIYDKYLKLGNFSSKEKVTIFILILTIILWFTKNTINQFFGIKLTDSIIALFGSFLFFTIPTKDSHSILSIDWYKKIPWNVLVLFGGGLSMASLIISTGLAEEFSKMFNFLNLFNLFTIILLVAAVTSIMTEFTSNTATTFLLLPILSLFALNNDMEVLYLTLPFVLAASCAFMMPIATPPNAIVYSSNYFKVSFMVSNGFFINLISVVTVSFYVYFFNFF